ncbi:MAG TPA: CoA pyrophosphatase [Polyangiaceae bacterium]|jgi:8-oxo-dGTP pyrophosphatase MutT (NUDIX family)
MSEARDLLSRERVLRALAAAPAELALAGTRQAAIAVILLEGEVGLEALLIERAIREGDPWSGHMALPGGHRDPEDADLSVTAERETLEEVGLNLRIHGERVGQLTDHEPVRAVPVAVRPFVYLLNARPELVLSAEVTHALWVPIAPLVAGERRTTFSFARGEQSFKFPAWDLDGRVVWGLTYRVLSDLFARLDAVPGLP